MKSKLKSRAIAIIGAFIAALALIVWIAFHVNQTIDKLRFELASVRIEGLGSLIFLERMLFSVFAIVLILCGWLAFLIYRDLIAPLRAKLVETQAQLERQDKLASLGVIATGIAHEIRNPLTAIRARLYTLQKQTPRGTPAFEDANVINQEISRLERIIKEFLDFARPSDPQFESVPANRPAKEVFELMSRQLGKRDVELRLEEYTERPVRIDPQQIKQVLINLVQNAADSIDGQGTITLRTRTDQIRLKGAQRKVIFIEVEDTGKGIPPEVQKHLFDPFFTTKESGTGLGLSIAAQIMEKHGGALRYQTQLQHGTTFGIVIPLPLE